MPLRSHSSMTQDPHRAAPRNAGSADAGQGRARRGARPDAVPKQSRSRWRPAGVLLGVAAVFLAVAALAAVFGRLATQPVPQYLAAPRHPAAAGPPEPAAPSPPPRSALAILVLGPAARGSEGSVLELLPAIHEVRVQWFVPPGRRDTAFRLSVNQGGKTLKTVGQLGGLREVGGSRVAEFGLDAGIFAGSADAARFVFAVSARDSGDTAGEYLVIIRKKLD